MSDAEALRIFSRQYVSNEMVEVLVATVNSVIQVKKTEGSDKDISLRRFICRLIKHSNVQTPTLMMSLVYLNRLRGVLPGNAVGLGTTRHRIFLSALILSAKALNDSSPLNKHWTKYTEGLLTNKEVNAAERELISLLRWNLSASQKELAAALHPFLAKIKLDLRKKEEAEIRKKTEYYRMSTFHSTNSLASTKSSIFSSTHSLKSSPSSCYILDEQTPKMPLRDRSCNSGHSYSAHVNNPVKLLRLAPCARLRAN